MSIERKSSGTIATACFFGFHTGVLSVLLFQTIFEIVRVDLYDHLFNALVGLAAVYLCSVLFFPWYSEKNMRFMRHLGSLVITAGFFMIFIMSRRYSHYGSLVAGVLWGLTFLLYGLLESMQPFKVEPAAVASQVMPSPYGMSPQVHVVTHAPPAPQYMPSSKYTAPSYVKN